MRNNIYILAKAEKSIQKIIFTGLAFIFCMLCSCQKLIEIDPPNSQLTTTAVFESKSTADAAMTDIYSQIRENGILTGKLTGIGSLMGNYSDELVSYQNGAYSSESFYNNSILASSPLISSMWNAAYSQIYAANILMTGVENSVTLTSAYKHQLTGEALFVRALIHFYLVNIFGDIPYASTTDYQVNRVLSRMASTEVYGKIISDLKTAIDLLPQNYISPDRMRPNKAVAQALLARVYLYTQAWLEASNLASSVLKNESSYIWDENLDHIFLKNSTTTIWQLAPAFEGRNTEESAFIFFSGPPINVALSDELMNSFKANDLRKSHWTLGVTEGADTWYHAFKYKQKTNTSATVECSIIFRLAEQYLIRAEARAQLNDLSGAKQDLNKVRHTAGLDDTPAATTAEIVDAVIEERRFEFFTEYGHRFFDLKRTGKLNPTLGYKPGWNNTDALWPVPQSELISNPNLRPQNAGY